MAHITADRVRDTSTSTGTGSFTVSGTAPTGFRTLSAVLSVGDTFYYAIQSQGLNEWEVGLGTYSSANVFARTTVLSSSNAGSAVSFSAGTKDVFLTLAATKTIQNDASGSVGTLQFSAGSASTPSITTSGDTNTGMFFPAADTIAFAEGGVEAMRIDSSANLLFNSGYGSAAVAYGCRAWVNFNGTGTVAIRASGNVTSITDNGSGDYTVNFTTAMPDANYSALTTTEADSSNDSRFIAPLKYNARTTTSVGLYTAASSANVRYDVAYVGVAIFR
jgi:hypothetical protein